MCSDSTAVLLSLARTFSAYLIYDMAPPVWESLRQILVTNYSRSAILYTLITSIILIGIFILAIRHMTTRTEHDQMLNLEKAPQAPPCSKDVINYQSDIIPAFLSQETSAYRRIRSSSEDPLAGVYYPVTSGQLASMADLNASHREQIQALTENVLHLEGLSESKG